MMTLILKAYVIKVCHDCHTKHHLFDLDLEKYGLSSLGHTHYGRKLPKLSKIFTCLLLLIISEVWVNILIITIFWLEMIRNNIVKSFICLNPINAAFYKTKMHHSFWTTFGNSVHSAHCCSSSILCSSYTHVIFTSSNRLGTKIVFTVWLFL